MLTGMSGPAFAQISGEQYQGLFLVGRFGEICTMCEVVVLCQRGKQAEAEKVAIPESGDFSLYHFQSRTFWSQIATIGEFFIANFSTDMLAARGHTRPVRAITVTAGEWSTPTTIEGRLILDPAIIELDKLFIDRNNRSWRVSSNADQIGYCHRLPLRDAMATIEQQTSVAN
jgi:hypothetical protein